MTTIPQSVLAPGRWQLATTLSSASFAVRNFGFRTVTGTIPIRDAHVEVDSAGDPVAIRALLDLAGIDTANERRDIDLQKPRLLDTANFPTLSFSAALPRRLDDEWEISGRLEGRQATDVELTARIVRHDADGQVTVHAEAVVDRQALGVRAPRPMIGRQVRVTIQAAFTPPR
jgi:polyisoprenoid-binding protein YceI